MINRSLELRRADVPVKFCVFDIIHLNGFDKTGIPIELRKQLLENVIDFKDLLHYVDNKKLMKLLILNRRARPDGKALLPNGLKYISVCTFKGLA